ncbi:hypothetical protein [Ruegeria arenilitoris]|uniref:hypothetical protein n=1 Tax=Ruegeria arenilitoris TaxID=1173585 RepID=UPI00147D6999|nr:hypothetical protein [Ruegeria arenilitoris]
MSAIDELNTRTEAEAKVHDAIALRMNVTLLADGQKELAYLQAAHIRAGSPKRVKIRLNLPTKYKRRAEYEI